MQKFNTAKMFKHYNSSYYQNNKTKLIKCWVLLTIEILKNYIKLIKNVNKKKWVRQKTSGGWVLL